MSKTKSRIKWPVVTAEVKDEADAILRRMGIIARADRIKDVGYIDDCEGENLKAPRGVPLCNGYKMCAIGSLWVSGDVKPILEPNFWGDDTSVSLPGVSQGPSRNSFLSKRPALKLAYIVLNEEAQAVMDAHPNADWDEYWSAAIEALFETEDQKEVKVDSDFLDKVIKRARKRLAKVEVAA